MIVLPPKGPQKCPICLRRKRDAIAHHIERKEFCDHSDCPFKEEIDAAVNQIIAIENCPFKIHPKRKL